MMYNTAYDLLYHKSSLYKNNLYNVELSVGIRLEVQVTHLYHPPLSIPLHSIEQNPSQIAKEEERS